MHLIPQLVPTWPKLAWVAEIAKGSDEVRVYHGPMVETADDWVVEAVWAGDFAAGDFDRTDLVFGSGVRLRGNTLVFVSAGSTLDRLCYSRSATTYRVSNSLGALLSRARLWLRDDYPDYGTDIKAICRGLQAYKRSLPTTGSAVELVYFNNLLSDGQALRETEKPDAAPRFERFGDYHGYLLRAASRIAENAADRARTYPVSLLTSISSGYDSVASTVLARRVGCNRAVTITSSTSLWRGSDSGAGIAELLGLECRSYPRTSSRFPCEESVWAVAGRPGLVNWTLFDYPEPLCVFFTGCHGDKMWERTTRPLADPFAIPSVAQLGFSEYRLLQGVFHCPVPHWGTRHVDEIHRLSAGQEMEPWTLHKHYDRPIARRIAEEAGVPRRAFGQRKRNTAHEAEFLWPYSQESKERFALYLRHRGIEPPSNAWVKAARRLSHWDNLVYMNLTKPLGFDLGLRRRLHHPGSALIFQWANHELKKRYERGLRETENADTDAQATRTRAART